MVEFMTQLAENEHEDSLLAAMRDWLVMGSYAGFRLSEWAQESKYARNSTFATWDKKRGGDGLAKAFTMSDLQFMGKSHKRITTSDKRILDAASFEEVSLRWRYQKNGDNGQKINYSRNTKNIKFCPVAACLNIRKRAQRLKVPPATPIAVYRDKGGSKHICNKDIAIHC